MGTNPNIDLSNVILADNFIEKEESSGELYDGVYTFSSFAGLSNLDLSSYAVKVPNIPKNLKSLSYTFNGLQKLSDISNIDFSNVLKFTNTFYNLPLLEDLSSLDLSNAQVISDLFKMCPNLKYLPKFDNIHANSVQGLIKNHQGGIIEDVGNVNISSDDGTVKDLFISSKINNIGDVTINSTLTGQLISGCEGLKRIGTISIDKIDIPSTSTTSIISKGTYVDSILEIGNIYVNENKTTKSQIELLNLPSSPVIIGNVVIDKNIGNISISAPNGKIGNVIVHNNNTSSITLKVKEVGVFSLKSGRAYIDKNVKKIKAFPYYSTSGFFSDVSSSGFEYWFDYISTPTNYIKNIVNSTIDISKHIGTPNKNYKAVIPLADLISVNPEYPYDFELKSYSLNLADGYSSIIGAASFTSEDITKVNFIKLVKIDDSTIGLDVDLEGIMDGSTISLSNLDISGLNVNFTADIDGQEFYGRTHLKLKGTIDFEITEDISSIFHIEYEEGEEPLPTEADETTE